jgi:hypothetical protein
MNLGPRRLKRSWDFGTALPWVRPEEKNFGPEEPNTAAMNPLFNWVLEETTRPRRNPEGLLSYNSEKLGDSTIDRP